MSAAEVRKYFEEWVKHQPGLIVGGCNFQLFDSAGSGSVAAGAKRSQADRSGPNEDSPFELVLRARAHDPEAIARLAQMTSALCRELESIWRNNPDPVREAAKTITDWPVALTLNKDDRRRALNYIKDLPLGQNAAFVTASSHKVDRSLFFSRYADNAIRTYRLNSHIVPLILRWAKLERRKFRSESTRDDLGNHVVWTISDEASPALALEDWMLKCVPGGERSVEQIWKAIKPSIRRFWSDHPVDYKAVMAKFAMYRGDDKKGSREAPPLSDAQKRERALQRIHQAITSLLSKSRGD
jgi:hypothetical protein